MTLLLSRTSLATRPEWQLRALRIALFVGLTALSARIRIELPGTPVPITAQTFVVFIAGMLLGSLEGAASQITYVGLIALGAPLDSRGLGTAALFSPTAGYLLAFIPGAFIAGLLRGRHVLLNILCGMGAALVIHVIGTAGVAISQKLSWQMAALLGSVPFILLDTGKALLAAALVNLGYARRFLPLRDLEREP